MTSAACIRPTGIRNKGAERKKFSPSSVKFRSGRNASDDEKVHRLKKLELSLPAGLARIVL
jgi:hypothetical protein